jgi:hypothetical protein
MTASKQSPMDGNSNSKNNHTDSQQLTGSLHIRDFVLSDAGEA